MKRLLALLCLALAILPVQADEIQLPHVTVFGTASVKAKPDVQRWSIAVTTKGDEVATASGNHAKRAADVLKFLKKKGVAPADVQTAAMSLSENRVYRDNNWLKDGYVAETSIAFTLRDPAQNQDIWLGLSQLADVSVNGVSWDIADRIPLQERARADAMTAGKAKAQQLAAGLASSLAEPLVIEEIPVDDPIAVRYAVNAMAKGSGGGSPEESAAPGELTVQARVKLVFRLVSP